MAARITGAALGLANPAEVVGKLIDAGTDVPGVLGLLAAARVTIDRSPRPTPNLPEPGSLDGGRALSLGSRSCLALTVRSDPAAVLTAHRA